MKSEKIDELVKAVVQVMGQVKNIEKSMTVGEGKMSYKAVSDKDVKIAVGNAMSKAGLSIIPIDVQPTTKIERWEEVDYNNKMKTKQSVFTEVVTTYLLTHISGQYVTVKGYGHGVDSQDKGAGKATTYALKYALLYTFLVPTGDIPDTDTMVSNNAVPQSANKPAVEKQNLVVGDANWEKVTHYIVDNMGLPTDQVIKNLSIKYKISEAVKKEIIKLKS